MDFSLYARVLWRFRLIVLLGLFIAASLALLSMIKIGSDGVQYRQSELWSSSMRLGVTQNGFPWGRLFAAPTGDQSTVAPPADGKSGIPIVDPARFNTLAVLYAELASSDPIRRLMLREGPIRGKIVATPLVADKTGTMLPIIDLTAISTSPAGAIALAQRSARALDTYVRDEQRANNVPASDSVILQVLLRPRDAEVFQPRSKTMPIVIFLAVLFVTVVLAFLLENLRPSVRPQEEPAELRGKARRSA
jgi:hypothetical protein